MPAAVFLHGFVVWNFHGGFHLETNGKFPKQKALDTRIHGKTSITAAGVPGFLVGPKDMKLDNEKRKQHLEASDSSDYPETTSEVVKINHI